MLESWVAQEVWAKEEMVEHLFTAPEEEEEEPTRRPDPFNW